MPKANSEPSKTLAAPTNYEAALKELEALVASMEAGELPLAQLLTGYQRGAELLAYCRAQLDAVEQQIKVLDNGSLKPWTAN
jgi:exodeoxyribonuclease VII small subunit